MFKNKLIVIGIVILLSLIYIKEVDAFTGCTLGTGGQPGCINVANWGSTNINQVVKNAAKANPGTTYMAWCAYTGATPKAGSVRAACDCPDLNPAPGTCQTDYCGACGNPVTKCAPGTPPPPPPTCTDECVTGQKMCSGNNLLVCGNFDNDKCTEWGIKKDCSFKKEEIYYVCEYDDSVKYKEIEKGFCNNKIGYNDYCDSYEYTEKIKEVDCGVSDCTDDEYCYNNDVYVKESCTIKGCTESTGMCFEEHKNNKEKVDECGSDYTSDEYCDGQNIVYEDIDRGCTEKGNSAYCFEDKTKIKVDECGPDSCTEYTELDIYTKEYVYDEESCVTDEYAYCAYDPGEIYDYCLNEDILMQSYCPNDDHAFQEFDCTSLPSCIEFTYEACVNCFDPYTQQCNDKKCNLIGMIYRDNYCGDGACQYEDMPMKDTDNDKIDDRCDDCIDVDHDGVCDDVDNCIGVKNPTQVDQDNDGLGNACDIDKDNDGYNEDEDCDDWDPKRYPGAPEIKNNGIDDDCNANTPDKGVYTPKQALHVDVKYDESLIVPGKDLDVFVTVTNNHAKDFEDLKVMVSMPGFNEKQAQLIRVLESGEKDSELFQLRVPSDIRSDYEFMRVSVSNDHYKRIIYWELKLPN